MSDSKEVVIFLPGLTAQDQEKEVYLNLISHGLTEQIENLNVKLLGEAKISGHTGKKFAVYNNNKLIKTIDIYEVLWLDLFSRLSTENLRNRVIRGIYLFFYWFVAKTWMSFKECPSLFFGLGLSLGLWILWYYGILAIALIAIGKDPTFLEVAPKWANFLTEFGKTMGSWRVWLIVSSLLSFLPVNRVVDIGYFAMQYLAEDTDGKVLRAKIRNRGLAILNDVFDENRYDKVTILAHSFGVVVGTDLLADYQNSQPIRYITLGGPLKLLSYKSAWIQKEIGKCLDNNTVSQWIDYYSYQDWMCTKTPIPKGYSLNKIQSKKSTFKLSFIKQLTGESHNSYFSEEDVLKTIVDI
ncbi:MAG TPA: hypothetical protein V6D12_16005 [Candidatus Obscuribacterales bacterium]